MAIYYGDGSNSTSGRAIQTVLTLKTNTTSLTANNSATAISGMSRTITPKDSNNKILITVDLSYGASGTTYGMWLRRTVGSTNTNLDLGDSSGSRQRVCRPLTNTHDSNQPQEGFMQVYDSPGTTSQVTYQVMVIADNAHVLFLNRSNNDLNNVTGKRCSSSILCQEIAV